MLSWLRPLVSLTAALIGLPPVTFSLASGTAAASVAGKTTIYPAIAKPKGVTAGPDGALWFANTKDNSVGRITTGGFAVNLTDPTISKPTGSASSPDGALWFTISGSS